jgi:hypothetical protein
MFLQFMRLIPVVVILTWSWRVLSHSFGYEFDQLKRRYKFSVDLMNDLTPPFIGLLYTFLHL